MAVSFQTGAEPIPGYTLLDRLGSGGFGEVWRCEAPGGIFKAVKVIHGDLRRQETDAYRFAEQELKSLKRVKTVRHPYLLALDRYDIVDGRLVIVMELADCNLWDRFRECRANGLPGIPRDELLQYMFESAEVLDLMNDKHQLQHLDIKPQNLFLLYNHVKVADFGQVKDLELHVAQVTGGITPVYAAPETFDGFVSRYCDQYSLACVYQELLTGVRPFDGASMNQLLMQHLQQPPNLLPSPPADRPALARALAKKADDRFPTVTAMVKAIRDGMPAAVAALAPPVPVTAGAAGDSGVVAFLSAAPPSDPPFAATGYADPAVYNPTGTAPPAGDLDFPPEATPYPRATADTPAPPDRPAPPEQTGPGPLRPAVVVGLGWTGQRVLRRLHRLLADRYGSARRVPVVRTVYIDTDPEAIAAAAAPSGDLPPLPAEGVVAAPLNRASYYLKPRNNGRALIEGWFDPAVLYRLPRTPVTTGLRALGRLAFCDHYRGLMQRVQAEIDAALDSVALAAARAATGLDVRTNRPRVYVVAGLGGGTGGGMALDLAYAVRHRLRKLGYADPDVVGVLLVPADGAVPPQVRANTFAALTELNHFSRPDTAFVAGFDEPNAGVLRDSGPPFTRTHLLRGFDHPDEALTQTRFPGGRPAGSSSTTTVGALHRAAAGQPAGDRDPAEPAAEFLRLDLLTPVGRAADAARDGLPAAPTPTVGTFGLRRFGWPRAAVVDRTARVIAPVLLGHWVDPDPGQVRGVVLKWADEQWKRLGLDGESLTARLRAAADRAAGGPVDELVRRVTEPLAPKGWRARPPEPQAVAFATDRLTALFGPPRDTPNRPATDLEEALTAAAAAAAKQAAGEVMAMIPALLDTQAFRLAGTEEVIRQLLLAVERTRAEFARDVPAHERAAAAAYDRLAHSMSPHKGVRRPTAAELADALRDYPTGWYRARLGKQAVAFYTRLHEVLVGRLSELATCRQRIRDHHAAMVAEADTPAPPPLPHDLLPAGCPSVEDAAQRFLKVLNDDDLNELEQRFQRQLTAQLGGVLESCLNSADGPHQLARILREVTRDYLNERMGEVDLYGMLRARFGSGAAVGAALERAVAEAEPPLTGRGPWANTEVCAFAAPGGAGGAPIGRTAAAVLPPTATVHETPDEVVVYREFPQVPLAALAQFGPAWAAAYQSAPELLQTSPHARTDITRWVSVDE
jgi:hypothetical protein